MWAWRCWCSARPPDPQHLQGPAERTGRPAAAGTVDWAPRCPAVPAFRDEGCTGVSAGTTLSGYRDGETVITTDKTLIEGKRIDCHVAIRAHGAVVRNSKINGTRNRPEETTYSSADLPRPHTPGTFSRRGGEGS
jgi:hypothetical protein